ncbi:MAG: Ni/Fe-hydrogenase, b-type cytochrome subunit [Deltaproteobacteria bacterium]|nr:MAG: Ni/Fe-hydrogenase, b-type cytochrome subunit [Deltaproteobacteria bacterium]
MPKIKAIKVWEFPIRVIHWTNFVSVVGLSVTGAYIHFPFLSTANNPDAFVMGYARAIHLSLGWLLMLGVIGRVIWGLMGNRFARLRNFLPFTYPEGRENLVDVIKYYTFASPRPSGTLGHNALASMAYLSIGLIMIFQVVSGFALYSQADTGGTAYALFGWVFEFMNNGYLRMAHYFSMFIFASFFITHIYAMWMSDVAERNGSGGSMFNGYKYGDPDSKI